MKSSVPVHHEIFKRQVHTGKQDGRNKAEPRNEPRGLDNFLQSPAT